jgi:hypothetical protein
MSDDFSFPLDKILASLGLTETHNGATSLPALVASASAVFKFMEDSDAEWAALSSDRQYEIIKGASDGKIIGDDLDLLIRRNVYMLVGVFQSDMSRFVEAMFQGIRNKDVRSILIVEVVRIMDALMPMDYDLSSTAPAIREKYSS